MSLIHDIHRLFTVFSILSFACSSFQNHLHCKYELNSHIDEQIDLLNYSCESAPSNDLVQEASPTKSAISHHIIRTSDTLLSSNARFEKLGSLRVEISPRVFQAANFENVLKLSNKTHQNIIDLEFLIQDGKEISAIHSEILSANQHINRSLLKNKTFSISAEETFYLSSIENISLEDNICINRWTPENSISKGNSLVEKNCHPSPENLKKSSIFLLKIVQELSENEKELHMKIEDADREILELKKELEKIREHQQ